MGKLAVPEIFNSKTQEPFFRSVDIHDLKEVNQVYQRCLSKVVPECHE